MSDRVRSAAHFSVLGAMLVLSLGTASRVEGARPSPWPGDSVRADRAGMSASVESGSLSRLTNALRGLSGKLFARMVLPSLGTPAVPAFARLFGDSSLARPGMYPVRPLDRPFSFITLHPFAEKHGIKLGGYRLGLWPAEKGRAKSDAYGNPSGFIEVTPQNEDMQVSEHFRLRDFLTHDQASVWPKFLVLNDKLVDKLELIIAELQREGVPVRHVSVMSGFRTPWYNAHGGSTSGRAEQSRHMYGDASDIFVDNDGNGRMDDLNRDGRIDSRDARVIANAAEIVGREHPDLAGGEGVYGGTRAHGPFAHVDVRGASVRWGRGFGR